MPRKLIAGTPDFGDAFEALVGSKRETDNDVSDTVAGIIADVIARGDAALIDLSRKFDNIDLAETGIAISAEEIAKARSACSAETLAALEKAAERIEASACGIRPWMRLASMCPAARPLIPAPC